MTDTFLRRRIWRKLQSLPDERLYQVLDYLEFMDSKYGDEAEEPDGIQRFAEGVQDKLRARKAAPWAMRGVMGALSLVDRAMGTAAKATRGLAGELGARTSKKDSSKEEDEPKRRSTKIVVE